jgi:hypothetical protein
MFSVTFGASIVSPPLRPSTEVGVGQPIQSLSAVRRADARSAQISRPEGKTH